jgi:hypothetical protein
MNSATAQRRRAHDGRGNSTSKMLRRDGLFREEVVEGLDGSEFVVADIKYGVELSDVENVVDLLGEIEEFKFAAGVAYSGETADEFADAGRIDVVHACEVEDDFFLASVDQATNGIAKVMDFIAEDDASGDVEDGDMGDFTRDDGQGH